MPEVPPETPVLVGVAAVKQKLEDYAAAAEPVALMEQALRGAAADANCVALLEQADEILVPKSLWQYSDPGRLLAHSLGAKNASTLLAEFGILQQSLLSRACQRISAGEARVVLVVGGEARYRELCAGKAGGQLFDTVQTDVEPDLTLTPEAEMWSQVEADSGLGMPVGYYAILDSALRHKQGLSVDEHRDQMANMYARMSEIAAANEDAWSTEAVSAQHIREASAHNRMLAFPYTKLHNSQWNVDLAAGLIFCSASIAQALGIDREKWVFPLAAAESNFMSVVASRKDLGGNPAFRIAGKKALELAQLKADDVGYTELYSCFPYAVRVQIEEMGLSSTEAISVTGGMTFAGGPLNHFVLQSTVKMAQLLREQPKEVGMVTTVSGMLTKQACALWSATPGVTPWENADVTDDVAAASGVCELVSRYSGPGRVAGYTVLYQGNEPWRAVAVFDIEENKRTVAFSEAAVHIERMLGDECCGESFDLREGQFY